MFWLHGPTVIFFLILSTILEAKCLELDKKTSYLKKKLKIIKNANENITENITNTSSNNGSIIDEIVNIANTEENTVSKYNSVKLTTKQGFLLNQLIGTYALENIVDPLCKNHTREFKTALRAFEPWALKMIDSSSKLQAGLLLGNLVEYGSYLQCLRISTETEYGPIMGKHCLIKISPSDDLLLKVLRLNNMEGKRKFVHKESFQLGWSVCVPHSCPADDVERHFNKTLMEITVGVELEVSLTNNYCRSQLDLPTFKLSQYLALAFYGLFILLGLVASVLDYTGSSSRFTETFSTYKHINRVFKLYSPGDHDFLYGLKFISSTFVVVGHRFVMFMIFPVINALDELEWPTQYPSLLIIGSTVCVDSFFMVSGMLVSLGFFEHVTKAGTFNLAAFYIYRYIRITLPMALVVLFYVTLAQFLADGPYAHDVYLGHQKPCEDYWWSILLHLQTIVNPGHLCLFPLWYLSCEMPFYFFSPIILYPLWKWPKIGYFILTISYLCFMTISFYLAWTNKYEGTPLPVTSQILYLEYFKKFYVAPHVRAPSYIVGLAFGYFLFITKAKKIRLTSVVKYTGWISALGLLVISAGGCRGFYLETHEYNRLEAASYLAFARPGWTFGMIWIIWCCMNGYGGILEDFLSAYVFKILGKLTYGFFLIHSIVQVYMGASSKVATTFSNFNAVYIGLADIMLCVILGFFFTIFFEMPLARLPALIFVSKSSLTVENSLLEEFACPVCFEYMDKKIYICVNGHSFCGRCNSKLSKCPICKVKLSSRRNINLEQAAKKVKEWKTKNEKSNQIGGFKDQDISKRRARFSVGSPIRAQQSMFLPENHIQCPHGKCCYFTKYLLQLKIHLQSWHPKEIFPIKKEPSGNTGKLIRVNMCWDLISEYNLLVLSTSDDLFIVFLNRVSSSVKSCFYMLNVLTVSDKTKMFKFTFGNVSKFSMFYQGKQQAQEGIQIDGNRIETIKRPGGYKYNIKFFIVQVAELHDQSLLEAIAADATSGGIGTYEVQSVI